MEFELISSEGGSQKLQWGAWRGIGAETPAPRWLRKTRASICTSSRKRDRKQGGGEIARSHRLASERLHPRDEVEWTVAETRGPKGNGEAGDAAVRYQGLGFNPVRGGDSVEKRQAVRGTGWGKRKAKTEEGEDYIQGFKVERLYKETIDWKCGGSMVGYKIGGGEGGG